MTGASLATGIALVLGFSVVFCSTLRRKSRLNLWKSGLQMKLMGKIILNGTSDFFREIAGSSLVLVVNLVLLQVSGMTAVAAYSVIANLGNVVLCGLAGVANTVQPLASYSIGAGNRKRAVFFLRTGVITTLILAGIYTLFAEFRPDTLVTVFLEDPTPDLLKLSTAGIRIISAGYVFAGLTNLLAVFMEAEHEPRSAFTVTILHGFALPLASLTVLTLLMDVNGVWISFLISEALSLLIAALMYRRIQIKTA